jgi:hypothetical protein
MMLAPTLAGNSRRTQAAERVQARRFTLDLLLLTAFAVVAGVFFFEGGAEALIGAGLGAVAGARSAGRRNARVTGAISGAFAGLFAGALFAGFFHGALVALASLFSVSPGTDT